MKHYFIYILTNKRRGVLYIGITGNLIKRIWEHKNKVINGFSKKYNTDKLVYIEDYTDPESAILREKRLKKWKRNWKIKLIESKNSEWKDLYDNLLI